MTLSHNKLSQADDNFIQGLVQIVEPSLRFLKMSLQDDYVGLYLPENNHLLVYQDGLTTYDEQIDHPFKHLLNNGDDFDPINLINDVQHDEICSMAIVPLTQTDEHDFGLFFTVSLSPKTWTSYDEALIQEAGQLLQHNLVLHAQATAQQNKKGEHKAQSKQDLPTLSNTTHLLQILDAIPDLVYVKDKESRLLWGNKAFTQFFDRSIDDLVGEFNIEGVGQSNIEASLQDDELVFSTGKTRVSKEEAIIRHDGRERQFITTKKPIFDLNGNASMLVGISTDITDTKNVERYLIEALEDQQALVELKSAFVSMVSHEFRTPLSVILSSVDIMQTYYDRLTPERRQDKLKVVQNQVKRLTKLMDDVLLINRGDVKGLPFSPSLVNIITLSERIIEEVESAHRDTDVKIKFRCQEACKEQYIDTNLYRHIVQNLLSNALKYSKPHSDVQFSINCTDDKLTLVVADTGIGIPQADQKNLFQTFHRANNVGTIQGTGLGLAIVKRAIDTHGGTINLRSIENQGTMFVVTLSKHHMNENNEGK